jgi:hypothetical protein
VQSPSNADLGPVEPPSDWMTDPDRLLSELKVIVEHVSSLVTGLDSDHVLSHADREGDPFPNDFSLHFARVKEIAKTMQSTVWCTPTMRSSAARIEECLRLLAPLATAERPND